MKTFIPAIFISTLLILGVFAFAEETSALTCPGVQTCTTNISIGNACAGSQNQQNCINSGGTCSGSTCNFTSCSTSGSWTCSDTTSGSCSYSDTCDQTGDITTTYYSCGSSAGSCTPNPSTEGGACSRNTNGTSCGSSAVCSGGSCEPSVTPPPPPPTCTEAFRCIGTNSEVRAADCKWYLNAECGSFGCNSGTGKCNAAPPAPTCPSVSMPTGLSPVGTITAGEYTLTWNEQSGASKYAIRINDPASEEFTCPFGGDICAEITRNSYTHTFQANKTYNWWVHAINSCGTWSDQGWATVRVIPPDTAAPTVTIGGAPGSWQKTNATASITCNDGTGVGCEASSNWKYMTPTTSPGTNCSTTLSDYTGSYPGAFLMQEHRWMCATAQDTNGNRRYTSTPVEFKVDKSNPSAPTSVSYSPNPDTTGTPQASWSGAADTGDSGIVSYDIRRSSNGGSSWTTVATSITATNWTQSPAVGSGTYLYQVKTKDGATNESAWSTNTNSVTVSICDSSSYTSCSTAGAGSQSNMCGSSQYYQIQVPADKVCSATWWMTPSAGTDYDLYASFTADVCPSTNAPDCRPYLLSGQQEVCTATNLAAGTYKAWVSRASGPGSYSMSGSVYSCKTATKLPVAEFSIIPSRVLADQEASFIGWLRQDYSGSGIGGKTVQLQCWNGTSWPTVASGTTESTGSNIGKVSILWNPSSSWQGNVSCKLNFAGDAIYAPSVTSESKTLAANVQCNKVTGPLQSSTSVTVNTAAGTKPVPVTVTHLVSDSDGSGVISQFNEVVAASGFFGNPPFGARIQMDDQPAGVGDCDDDLVWDTKWPASGNTLSMSSVIQSKDFAESTHSLTYGFSISMSNAVIKSTGTRTASKTSYIGGSTVTLGTPASPSDSYGIVECTTNAHCTPGSGNANSDANANTAKCNLGITANFPQNTCIDSVAPTITIGEIKRTHSGLLGSKVLLATPETPGTDPLGRQWLRDGRYEISVSVTDNPGGSGVDTSYRPVMIRSIGADDIFGPNPITGIDDDKKYSLTRSAEDKFSVWVGSPDSLANDCIKERVARCRIEVYVRDLAGNTPDFLDSIIPLNIDYTPPSAQ